jgi:putative hydrolase of the HAD superfamily
LALRAVAFDYGRVLSGPPHPEAYESLQQITRLSQGEFEERYWVDRLAYDRGDLSGLAFWKKFVGDASLNLSDVEVARLSETDASMWTTANAEMLDWHRRLKEHGFRTAILSNMGDSVLENIERTFPWISGFDVLVWSYQHGMVKPEPEIYNLLLERLGTSAEETLFLDDKMENIEAARQLGIQALQFSSVEQLRDDLVSEGFDQWLPLP